MPQLAKNANINWPAPPEPLRKVGRPGKAKARKRRKDPTEGLLVANPNAAAIDIVHALGLRFYAGVACFSDHATNFRKLTERQASGNPSCHRRI